MRKRSAFIVQSSELCNIKVLFIVIFCSTLEIVIGNQLLILWILHSDWQWILKDCYWFDNTWKARVVLVKIPNTIIWNKNKYVAELCCLHDMSILTCICALEHLVILYLFINKSKHTVHAHYSKWWIRKMVISMFEVYFRKSEWK